MPRQAISSDPYVVLPSSRDAVGAYQGLCLKYMLYHDSEDKSRDYPKTPLIT